MKGWKKGNATSLQTQQASQEHPNTPLEDFVYEIILQKFDFSAQQPFKVKFLLDNVSSGEPILETKEFFILEANRGFAVINEKINYHLNNGLSKNLLQIRAYFTNQSHKKYRPLGSLTYLLPSALQHKYHDVSLKLENSTDSRGRLSFKIKCKQPQALPVTDYLHQNSPASLVDRKNNSAINHSLNALFQSKTSYSQKSRQQRSSGKVDANIRQVNLKLQKQGTSSQQFSPQLEDAQQEHPLVSECYNLGESRQMYHDYLDYRQKKKSRSLSKENNSVVTTVVSNQLSTKQVIQLQSQNRELVEKMENMRRQQNIQDELMNYKMIQDQLQDKNKKLMEENKKYISMNLEKDQKILQVLQEKEQKVQSKNQQIQVVSQQLQLQKTEKQQKSKDQQYYQQFVMRIRQLVSAAEEPEQMGSVENTQVFLNGIIESLNKWDESRQQSMLRLEERQRQHQQEVEHLASQLREQEEVNRQKSQLLMHNQDALDFLVEKHNMLWNQEVKSMDQVDIIDSYIHSLVKNQLDHQSAQEDTLATLQKNHGLQIETYTREISKWQSRVEELKGRHGSVQSAEKACRLGLVLVHVMARSRARERARETVERLRVLKRQVRGLKTLVAGLCRQQVGVVGQVVGVLGKAVYRMAGLMGGQLQVVLRKVQGVGLAQLQKKVGQMVSTHLRMQKQRLQAHREYQLERKQMHVHYEQQTRSQALHIRNLQQEARDSCLGAAEGKASQQALQIEVARLEQELGQLKGHQERQMRLKEEEIGRLEREEEAKKMEKERQEREMERQQSVIEEQSLARGEQEDQLQQMQCRLREAEERYEQQERELLRMAEQMARQEEKASLQSREGTASEVAQTVLLQTVIEQFLAEWANLNKQQPPDLQGRCKELLTSVDSSCLHPLQTFGLRFNQLKSLLFLFVKTTSDQMAYNLQLSQSLKNLSLIQQSTQSEQKEKLKQVTTQCQNQYQSQIQQLQQQLSLLQNNNHPDLSDQVSSLSQMNQNITKQLQDNHNKFSLEKSVLLDKVNTLQADNVSLVKKLQLTQLEEGTVETVHSIQCPLERYSSPEMTPKQKHRHSTINTSSIPSDYAQNKLMKFDSIQSSYEASQPVIFQDFLLAKKQV